MSAMDIDAKLALPLDQLIKQHQQQRPKGPKAKQTARAAGKAKPVAKAAKGGANVRSRLNFGSAGAATAVPVARQAGGGGKMRMARGPRAVMVKPLTIVADFSNDPTPAAPAVARRARASPYARPGGAAARPRPAVARPDIRNTEWGHDQFVEEEQAPPARQRAAVAAAPAVAGGNLTTGTKLIVGNLDPSVTLRDVKELFGAIGPIRSATLGIVSDSPKLVAEIVFVDKADAHTAFRKYNDRLLDGEPLKIKVASNFDSSAHVHTAAQAAAARKPQLADRLGPSVRSRLGNH